MQTLKLSSSAAKKILMCSYGHLKGKELRQAVSQLQLPLHLNTVSDDTEDSVNTVAPSLPEKSKGGRPRNSSAAAIYAEDLRSALIAQWCSWMSFRDQCIKQLIDIVERLYLFISLRSYILIGYSCLQVVIQ